MGQVGWDRLGGGENGWGNGGGCGGDGGGKGGGYGGSEAGGEGGGWVADDGNGEDGVQKGSGRSGRAEPPRRRAGRRGSGGGGGGDHGGKDGGGYGVSEGGDEGGGKERNGVSSSSRSLMIGEDVKVSEEYDWNVKPEAMAASCWASRGAAAEWKPRDVSSIWACCSWDVACRVLDVECPGGEKRSCSSCGPGSAESLETVCPSRGGVAQGAAARTRRQPERRHNEICRRQLLAK